MGIITSHQPTKLEELLNQGFKERGRTRDEECIVLEDGYKGIIYDIKKEQVVGSYPIENWQKRK